MECPEKKELQRKCTSTWDHYAAAVKTGTMATKGIPPMIAPELLRLYEDRLKASDDLSRHLGRHRC